MKTTKASLLPVTLAALVALLLFHADDVTGCYIYKCATLYKRISSSQSFAQALTTGKKVTPKCMKCASEGDPRYGEDKFCYGASYCCGKRGCSTDGKALAICKILQDYYPDCVQELRSCPKLLNGVCLQPHGLCCNRGGCVRDDTCRSGL